MSTLLLSLLTIFAVDAATLQQAKKALEKKDYPQAERLYRQLLESEPEDYESKFGLARTLLYSERRNEAIRLYTELLQANPDNADVLVGRGAAYGFNRQYREAEADLRQALNRIPEYAEAWMLLGNVYYWQEKSGPANEAYSQWVRLEPKNPSARISRAKTYYQAKMPDSAKEDLDKAKELGASEDEINTLLHGTTAVKPESGEETTGDLVEPKACNVAYPWQFSPYYTFHSLTDNQSDWHTYGARIQYQFDLGSVALDGFQTQRFSEEDEALMVEGFFDLWNSAYANLRFQVANDADFLPRADLYGELFQGVGGGWELSGSYRHMDFENNDVDIYNFSVGKFIENWYLRGRIYFTPETESLKLSYGLSARYYFDDEDFIEAGGGFGEETTVLGTALLGDPIVQNSQTQSASLQYQNYLTDRIGISLGYLFYNIDHTWSSHGVSARMMYRW